MSQIGIIFSYTYLHVINIIFVCIISIQNNTTECIGI